jgi:hypothetical protein
MSRTDSLKSSFAARQRQSRQLWPWALPFVGGFFYLWLIVNPRLVYDFQQPAFLATGLFLQQFLSFPGGPIEYCGAFFSQLLYHPAGGAFLIVALLLTITLQCRDVIRRIASPTKAASFVQFFPFIILLGIHGCYAHTITYDLQFTLCLLGFQVFIRTPNLPRFMRPFASVALCCLLYYAGGVFTSVPFALLCISSWLLCGTAPERITGILSVFFAAVLLPLAVYNGPFMLTHHRDLHYLQALWNGYTVPVIPMAPLFLLPLTLPLLVAAQRYRWKHLPRQKFPKSAPIARSKKQMSLDNKQPSPRFKVGEIAVSPPLLVMYLMALATIFAWFSFDRHQNAILRIDRYADGGQWRRLLLLADAGTYKKDREVCLQVNRALYHTGMLGERMFAYCQVWSVDGLFPNHLYNHYRCLKAFGDISFELGNVNQSLRWGYENIANKGYTAEALNMVIRANMVNGYPATVRKLVGILETTVNGKSAARDYRDRLDHPEAYSLLQSQERLGPGDDFVFDPNKAEVSLINILTAHPANRMAYEYLMTYSLLKADFKTFLAFLPMVQDYKYAALPRHYQEALLAWQSMNNNPPLKLGPYRIDPDVQNSFSTYRDITRRTTNAPQEMQMALNTRFGATYWYYLQYTLPRYHQGIQAMGLKEEGMYKSGGEF